MGTEKYNYYRDELSKLKETEYYPTIQIRDGNGNNTKWLALNEESIPIIMDYLSELMVKKS